MAYQGQNLTYQGVSTKGSFGTTVANVLSCSGFRTVSVVVLKCFEATPALCRKA